MSVDIDKVPFFCIIRISEMAQVRTRNGECPPVLSGQFFVPTKQIQRGGRGMKINVCVTVLCLILLVGCSSTTHRPSAAASNVSIHEVVIASPEELQRLEAADKVETQQVRKMEQLLIPQLYPKRDFNEEIDGD